MPKGNPEVVRAKLGQLSLVPVKKTKGKRSMDRVERVVNDKALLCECEVKLNSSFRAILSVV